MLLILQYKKDLAPFYTELNPLLKLTLGSRTKNRKSFYTVSQYDNLFTFRLSTL